MNELINITRENGQAVVSSREVAEHFEKRHDHVLRDIEGVRASLPKSGDTLFYPATYVNEQNGQKYPMYHMTRDGFTLLAMSFTGKAAMAWKIKYIDAFNAMESALQNAGELEDKRIKAMLAHAKEMNAESRKACQWLKSAKLAENETQRQECASRATAALNGGVPVIPMPCKQEKLFTATEVGKLLGVSSQKVGALANANGLKQEAYGQYFRDKSAHSSKEVQAFRYNKAAVDKLRGLLKA